MLMFNEKRTRKSELLQILLLDNLYAQSGSERIIFQGGTALRFGYSGLRFSEDLDFVTDLPPEAIERVLTRTFHQTQRGCIAQFGPGQWEYKDKRTRTQAAKGFFIYRPQTQRERIAVKMDFEMLKPGQNPEFHKFILRDLPLVGGLIAKGELILPYSSSILLVETLEEILSDKIRAIYERRYLKGRDIYDIWWLNKQLKIAPQWMKVKNKLHMYEAPFVLAREADYFQKMEARARVIEALEADLPRFLPGDIISIYEKENFKEFFETLKAVTSTLMEQGMLEYFETYERKNIDH